MEARTPAPTEASGGYIIQPVKGIPRVSWLARLTKSENSGFKRKTLAQYIRRIEEDIQCQSLASRYTGIHATKTATTQTHTCNKKKKKKEIS